MGIWTLDVYVRNIIRYQLVKLQDSCQKIIEILKKTNNNIVLKERGEALNFYLFFLSLLIIKVDSILIIFRKVARVLEVVLDGMVEMTVFNLC